MVSATESSDGLRIRPARKSDLGILVDFMARLAMHVAGGAPRTLRRAERKRLRELLAAALEDQDRLVVVAALPEVGPVGMAYIYVWRSQGIWEQLDDLELKSGVIDDVWVEPDYRKLGIFRAMLAELLAFAEQHDVQELILEYSLSNREAEATWSRLGFQPTGVRAAAFTANVRKAISAGQ
ncbi:GNAT family N-acetyltransferase [Haliea atlantica]|nr:GNAT family N-acetyltransferase [Haliea sp.]|tara:strand:+ start:16058 stop:16600 length:543 start_codon:yes stop_codon:yes gene_type:complete